MKTGQKSSTRAIEREIAIAVFKSAVDAAMRLKNECSSACIPACAIADSEPASPSRMFRATADQVRAVREFVKARFAGHPAVDEAVLVASELATNSVAYSASGRDGGLFLVHLAEVSATHAAVLITEQRGPGRPVARDAEADAESGRGLAVVKSLTSLFRISEVGDVRSILAVVSAQPDWPVNGR